MVILDVKLAQLDYPFQESAQSVWLIEYGSDRVAGEYNYSVGLELWAQLLYDPFKSQHDLLKMGIPCFDIH